MFGIDRKELLLVVEKMEMGDSRREFTALLRNVLDNSPEYKNYPPEVKKNTLMLVELGFMAGVVQSGKHLTKEILEACQRSEASNSISKGSDAQVH